MTEFSCTEQIGRVALIVGGNSPERAVSIDGGTAISAALGRLGIEHVVVDGTAALFSEIKTARVDRVFNLMHGPGGEDGCLTGALKLLNIPITGSSVLGSALSMDKVRSKQVWQSQGIPTTPFILTSVASGDTELILKKFGLPLFVKPVDQGSSLGISKVTEAEQLQVAIEFAATYGEWVMVEPGIEGREYFAGIIGAECLPLIAVEPVNEFYDYEAKYESDETQYFCPCGLPAELEEQLKIQAKKAFDTLGASGWGRVDFILDKLGKPWFLEVNTIPGMTDHSLIPQAAAQAGTNFDRLVWRILETSITAATVATGSKR